MTKACLLWRLGTAVLAVHGNSSCCSMPRVCMQASASRVSLTDVCRERPPTKRAHPPPIVWLICHRRGRRRNHRLLLRSKMKTEPYWNRGFFLKTEPKSTDLAECETVTTLELSDRKYKIIQNQGYLYCITFTLLTYSRITMCQVRVKQNLKTLYTSTLLPASSLWPLKFTQPACLQLMPFVRLSTEGQYAWATNIFLCSSLPIIWLTEPLMLTVSTVLLLLHPPSSFSGRSFSQWQVHCSYRPLLLHHVAVNWNCHLLATVIEHTSIIRRYVCVVFLKQTSACSQVTYTTQWQRRCRLNMTIWSLVSLSLLHDMMQPYISVL